MIKSQQLAVDEDGVVLVWTGAAGAPPEQASPAAAPVQSEVMQAAQPPQVEPPPPAPTPPDAERRQLTVMFCDLVGSTPLSAQLDPEELRDVVRAYQQTCTAVVQRYDGHVAQLLGDALLVYFGWPQAHEDDAQRAVRAGLGMLDAMATLRARLEPEQGIRLAIRVGIHTGLVVVGEMGGGGHQEQLALGETPNIASRLQGMAEPDTMVISEATYRLLQGYVTVEDLGPHALKGIGVSMAVYRVLQETAARTRFDVATARGLTPLVGREDEFALLQRCWRLSTTGQGQTVLLTGEGGIGKSRLVEVLREWMESEGCPRISFWCSPYHTNSALYPVIEHVQRLLQFQRDDTPAVKLDKLERRLETYSLSLPEAVPLLAALLSVPLPEGRYPVLNVTPQRQRQQTLDALVAWLVEEAERQPVLVAWEDLHWADPSTLEMLGLVLAQTPTVPMLHMLTFRPEFALPWPTRSHMTPITLNRLERPQVEALITHLAGGKTLPVEVVQHIVTKTDGVPLYVEELTKMLLESDLLHEETDAYMLTGPLLTIAIPDTLQDSLMARLDQLNTAKEIAQLGAVLGREFASEVIQAVSPLDEATLQHGLGRLVEAGLLDQRGLPPRTRYIFKHALIQDTAYQSVLKRTRQQYHQKIAQTLAERFLDTAETQPELLAHHYTEASLPEQAIAYWQRAGVRAVKRSANREAVHHFTQGLEVLQTLPDSPARSRQELILHINLGAPMLATRGYAAPEVGRVYTRARELCQQVGETPQLVQVLMGLWMFYAVRAELQTAYELGEQLFRFSQRQHDPARSLEAYQALGITKSMLGELSAARELFEQGIACYDSHQHRPHVFLYGQDSQVVFLCHVSLVLWLLGYPDQALKRCRAALTCAQELAHAFSLSWVLLYTAMVQSLCREVPGAQERVQSLMTLSREHGFAYRLAQGRLLWGWACAEQGQGDEGIAQMRQDLTSIQATGAEVYRPYYLALLAQAYAKVERIEAGLTALDEARTLIEKHGERWYEAEIYRLTGQLLLLRSSDNAADAETCFQKALDIARRQHAKSLELRAATSLTRLWQSQGRRQEAYDLLAPVYNWFTEGFDTADLQEAKELLARLGD